MARDIRRHHAERMKHRARRLGKGPLQGYNQSTIEHIADNLTVCSCWACGNPRRHHAELTLQERREAEGWGGLG